MRDLEVEKFICQYSSDGGFLQSKEWRNFQESVGRKTYCITGDNFYASIIEHKLPIVGKYFYVPRGPVTSPTGEEFPISIRQLADQFPIKFQNSKSEIQNFFNKLIDLTKKENAGWIRIEPANDELLKIISEVKPQKFPIKKAPHNTQPREIFIIDITKSEEQLLSEMKPKTRYNIKVAQKHNVRIRAISNFQFSISQPKADPPLVDNKIPNSNDQSLKFYVDKFSELVKITAKRDGITPHPESYYRKMFETIPGDILKLYVAEYKGKIIAANIIVHYGNTATYLHGASDNEHRNVMAPYLLQWQAIKDAKTAGLAKYDFGGIKTLNPKSEILNPKQIQNSKFLPAGRHGKIQNSASSSWHGITRFKTGFASGTQPVQFPGSYDIIINRKNYLLYGFIQKIKMKIKNL